VVRSRSSILVVLSIAVAAIAAPSFAGAATVEVVVDQNTHKIVFAGGGGELNIVSLGVVGELGDPTTYSVTDSTAPIVAGSGCSGGGPAGSTAMCPLPRSALPCVIRGCPMTPPVTNEFEINLGDGDDSLDSTGLPASDGGSGSFSVHGNGGSGADSFVDGPNGAVFDPGTGADSVAAGAGSDIVRASGGSPDEADLYDLGAAGSDLIDYRGATYPVTISLDGLANDGGAGEADQVLDAEAAVGGSADDELIGADDGSSVDQLSGFGGDDLIIGGAGNDLLTGDSGNDTIRGQSGRDRIHGDGDTREEGDDLLSGGSGRDFVQGYGGSDRLRGGFGSDLLVGATSVTRDGDVDRLDCGPSRDRRAYVGPEDVVHRCEGTRGPR
jgi:Ca2+-binding RTX toxin-like protein